MSRYDGSDSYTYPDSDVLKNKAGLHVQSALDAFEADTTAFRLLELSEYPIPGKIDLPHLQAIHRHLFHDVYDWAGQLRTVDISKGGSRFGNSGLIESYLGQQLENIAKENFLIAQAPEAFIQRLAHYMSEINAAQYSDYFQHNLFIYPEKWVFVSPKMPVHLLNRRTIAQPMFDTVLPNRVGFSYHFL